MKRTVCLLLSLFFTILAFCQTIKYTGSLCQGGSLTLSVDGAPANASYQWKREGSNDILGTQATLVINAAGKYSVVVTSNGVPTTVEPVDIAVKPNPVANFSFDPGNQCASVPVHFANLSTGTGLSYAWSFGDPNSGGNNTSSVPNPIHRFVGSAGNTTQTLAVSLKATNEDGCSNTITKNVTFKQSPNTVLGGPGKFVYANDNKTYFRSCTGINSFDFDFDNQSTTNNTSYRIVWGDGTPDFSAATFTTAPVHNYKLGTTEMLFIVSGQNGCTDTSAYNVFVGSNPAVGLGNPGNTTICTGSSLTFPISNTSLNPPGTIYRVTFNDGTAPITYQHPAPAEVTHQFNKTSCGTTSGAYPNSFSAAIQASNPCQSSSATVVPIYVSQKPNVAFTTPSDKVCVSTAVSFTNSSGATNYIDNGNCLDGKAVWSISPATGWSVSNGALGSDNGRTDPVRWTAGSNTLSINFSIPGTYTIRLKSGNPLCGEGEAIKTICVSPRPVASFTVDKKQGCGPLAVKAANTSDNSSCGDNTYRWSVSYANTAGCTPNAANFNYINNTSSTSINPEFQFINPGTYTITLVAISPGGACESAPVTQTITVKEKPRVSLNIPAAICQNGFITPTATVNNCYSSTAATYAWSFPNGTPETADAAVPGNITYNIAGPQTISLTVTNECGATTATQSLNVRTAPNVVVPANQNICAGTATGGYSFSSSLNGTTFNWTNSNPNIGLAASGAGNIPNFTALNNTTAPLVATITVTPLNGCSGPSATFTITVNPRPSAPTIISPITYCLNSVAQALTATATSGNTLTWYNNSALTNGSATAPTPVTTVAGSTIYYVTQSGGDCASAAAAITVRVLPGISGNNIGTDQNLCTGNAATTVTGQATLTGGAGSFTYQWQSSTDGGTTWNNIAGAITASYNPGVPTTSIKLRRVVSSGPCTEHISNVVTINVQGALSNFEISGAQAICARATPAKLDGQTPASDNPNFSFQWQQSADGSTWTNIPGATEEDYQPPTLSTTTYYKRSLTSGSCTASSSAIRITVNAKPVLASLPDLTYCNNTAVPSITFSATPVSGISYAWTNNNIAIGLATSGTGSMPGFTAVNNNAGIVPEVAEITVIPSNTNNGLDCKGDAGLFKLTVLPLISIQPIADQVLCAGSNVPAFTPVHNAGDVPGRSVAYSWTVTGSGIGLANGSGNSIPAYTTINTSNSDLIATITVTPRYSYNGKSCDGTPVSYKVTVKPSTPAAAAGPDALLCATPSYTMMASAPGTATGVWTQIGGPNAIIADPASPSTQINGLQPGNTYRFEWTVSGFAGCAPTKDIVDLQVFPEVSNAISEGARTICSGQSLAITGQAPSGGNGTYQYQWQFSATGTNWTSIMGQTGKDLMFTPVQSGFVRRVVSSQPCTKESTPVQITVQAAVSNNNISGDQSICLGNTPLPLVGSAPTGANGTFLYQWQKSTDNGATWTDIPTATDKDYSPTDLQTTTRFRRRVSSDLCSGPQSSTSNSLTITVNMDAKALFTYVNDTACAPFRLDASRVSLRAFPDLNGTYEWYVDGNLLGSGNSFPGFTLNGSNESALVKLKAISRYGCKNDSMEHRFVTIMEPKPAFTISTGAGCGPLSVQINNTTPDQALFQFYWTYGDGRSSRDTQPGSVIFQPNANAGDTTYIITLHAITQCDTLSVSKPVLVKSKPKALFTPSKTVGCSPMRVTFNNTSLGKVDVYTWDFGDGTVVTTSKTDTISHTFITGVRDTFYVTLKAENECGADSQRYAIVVSPNRIFLDFAVNGNEQSGCTPHTLRFINNSKGASTFRWDFGDGNVLSTTRNIDTVTHTYQQSGTYQVQLWATNGCSDTSTTEQIVVYPTPKAAFSANQFSVCIGDSVRFTNTSDSATSYLWQFGDGSTSSLVHPTYQYKKEGLYTIVLKSIRNNALGNTCTDTISRQINVVKSIKGWYTATDTVGNCAPLTITFTNQNTPAVTTSWDFGDGTKGTGDVVTHTFAKAGAYTVTLTAVVPGGCTYVTTRQIQVLGPSGTFSYQGGFLCNEQQARFQVQASNTDSIRWNFGDGTVVTNTDNVVYHTYTKGGIYLPSATLISKAGCQVVLNGTDSIKVDKLRSGFTLVQQQNCGWTHVVFSDTTRPYFGKTAAFWSFGDGTTGAGYRVDHDYRTSGTYTVRLIVTGSSGCTDTVSRQVQVKVNDKPNAAIQADNTGCTNTLTQFRASVQSIDSVSILDWSLSNGAKGSGRTFTYNFVQPGSYTLRLIAGTIDGCYDTTTHTIQINASPIVTASADKVLCLGNSTQLSATGAPRMNWSPVEGLSCTNCPDPVATPKTTTTYIAQGINAFGCSAYDTVLITVIQPIQVRVSANDSICIGQSSNLLASGATTYSWSPAASLNSTTISNPTATPSVTTTYRVVGYDGYNCFTDTAFVTVAVGQYPTITLGADLTLATGTLHPLSSVVQNGPIRRWEWSPGTDLSCAGCPLPVAHIKKDISYSVKATTAYGCSATDTVNIKVFCENSQLFIPNTFTPDGDGINDILMVRGKGIASVKTFRIFNRWGEVVFERSNFSPNSAMYGWDGKVKGTVGGPDVYVYTAEVICENGTTYTYKGNVSIIK